MSTIQDVAKMANVSVATVSRVINNSPSVAPETRETVLHSIKQLNYQPNLLGRNLRRMETRMIIVLLPNISNPFYARVVKGIEDIGHKNGYNVLLCNTDSDINRERLYIDLLKNRLSDGVIFMAPELCKEELSSIKDSFPVVQCCEYREGADVSYVSIDNTAASYKAVMHLINQGHKRIGMISSSTHVLSIKQREEGYKKALQDSGLKFDSSLIVHGDYSYKSGLRLGKHLLSMNERPTAIFAISDIMAVGVIRSARENGLRIPDDLAVIGFDNISLASMCEPLLTTISQPKYDMGCIAMELLLKQIKSGNKEPQYIFLEHELIIRETTIKN